MVDKGKIMEYMDWVYLVNSEEVYCVAQDAYAFEVYWDSDAELAMNEVWKAQTIADEYIERKWIKFDEEWDIIDNPF